MKKYKSFLSARLDLYKEMWEKGFDKEYISKLLRETKRLLKRKNPYSHGIYLFKTFNEEKINGNT